MVLKCDCIILNGKQEYHSLILLTTSDGCCVSCPVNLTP